MERGYNLHMKPTFKGLVASSQDPTEIANTVKGIVLALSSVIVFTVAQFMHITLSATDVMTLATDLGTAAGAVWTVYGLILKLVVFFGKKPA